MGIKNIKAFSVLKDSELSLLSEKMVSKQFKKDEVLIKKGTIANDIIFLNSGIVSSIYTNKSKTFISYLHIFIFVKFYKLHNK